MTINMNMNGKKIWEFIIGVMVPVIAVILIVCLFVAMAVRGGEIDRRGATEIAELYRRQGQEAFQKKTYIMAVEKGIGEWIISDKKTGEVEFRWIFPEGSNSFDSGVDSDD